jgi:hypothetical protein
MKFINEGQCRKRKEVVLSGLTPPQVYEMIEWWSSVKPLGSSVTVEVLQNGQTDFVVATTGHEPENRRRKDVRKESAA